ncbi:MAG: hypothetical protein JNM94_14150 [Phycisphaerae bacterium]|nr:hypothetical protein [Phycisphaerae bacterium]
MFGYSPIVVAALAFVGVLLVQGGLLGRRDWSKPTCRACGRDALPHVWETAPVCACGRMLSRRGAVRPTRTGRPRVLVAGVVTLALAIAIGWIATGVRSRAIGWIDELPTWAFSIALEHGACDDERTLASVRRRLDLDPSVAPALRDALLRRLATTSELDVSEEWEALALAFEAAPDVDGTMFAAAMHRAFVTTVDGNGEIEVGRFVGAPRFPFVLARVDEVRIDDALVPWSDAASQPASCVRSDPWHGTSLGAGRRIELDPRRIAVARSLDSLHVKLTVALPISADLGVSEDRSVREIDDWARWGVDVVTTEVVVDGTVPFVPALRRAPSLRFESWSTGEVTEVRRCESRRHAAAPVAAAAAVGGAIGGAFAIVSFISRRISARLTRLTPPRCRRCRYVLNVLDVRTSRPGRCSECGTSVEHVERVDRIDRGSRWSRRGARAVAALATCALSWGVWLWLMPLESSPVTRWLRPSPHDFAWLIEATASGARHYVDTQPAERLARLDLVVDRSILTKGPGQDFRADAFQSLLAWARDPASCVVPTARDPHGLVRRIILNWFLQASLAGKGASRLTWVAALDPLSPPPEELEAIESKLAIVVPLDVAPLVCMGMEESVERSLAPSQAGEVSVGFSIQLLPQTPPGDRPSTIRTSVIVTGASSHGAPIGRVAAPPEATAVDIVWLPPRTSSIPPELCTSALARRAKLEATITEAGTRDLVTLSTPPFEQGVLWLGRWEILENDASQVAGLVAPSQGRGLSSLVPFAGARPERLHVRFVPAPSPPSGAEMSGLAHWPRVTTFQLVRVEDASPGMVARGARTRYRVADASVE